MAHVIEAAKSGRASCKVCKKSIAKGELRLGEEYPNPFSEGEMAFRWHHLECGAKKKASVLKEALESTEVEIPNKADLEKLIDENAKKEKPARVPFAEFAPTGRAACAHCSQKIEKGVLRIAVNTDTEPDGFGFKKGFIHPACSVDFCDEDSNQLLEQVKTNSRALEPGDFEKLEAENF